MTLAHRDLLRRLLVWLAITLGMTLGFAKLVQFGEIWLPSSGPDPDWLVDDLRIASLGFSASVFLAGSLMGLRNQRRLATAVFAFAAPIAAFALTYPDHRTYLERPEGGFLDEPSIGVALLLAVALTLPLMAVAWLALRQKRRLALYLLLAISIMVAAAIVFTDRPWTPVLVPPFAGWAALFLAFAAFWWTADQHGWPMPSRKAAGASRLQFLLVMALVIIACDLSGTFLLLVLRPLNEIFDCNEQPPFARPLNSRHTAFVAQMIYTGHTVKVKGRWAGDWGIGLVQESFWGLPPWTPRLVLLTRGIFWDGDTYLVSGGRLHGMLTGALPIVDVYTPCFSYALPLKYASLPLRLFRHPPAPGETRILGYAQHPLPPVPHTLPLLPEASESHSVAEIVEEMGKQQTYTHSVDREPDTTPLAHARIRVTGPSVNLVVTTDENGVYETPNLPAADYTLRLLDTPIYEASLDRKIAKGDLLKTPLLRADLSSGPEGSIDGRIIDAATGQPADHLSADVQSPGSAPDSYSGYSAWPNEATGRFHFGGLPVGSRHLVQVNGDGPTEQSPYARSYCLDASSPDTARVFEIKAADQHIQNVECRVHRLVERTLPVHVTLTAGRSFVPARIRVARQDTRLWNRPDIATIAAETVDYDGNPVNPVIHLFGDVHVRVLAEQILVRADKTIESPRYSELIELDPRQLPARLELTISPTRFSPPHQTSFRSDVRR